MSDKLPACRGFRQRATQRAIDKLAACRTFSEEPSCWSRRPERMKSAPRNVRQAASLSRLPARGDSRCLRQAGSLSRLPARGDSESPRQAASLSDIFRRGADGRADEETNGDELWSGGGG